MNTNICDRFSVGHYPMLLWGPPPKFASAKWAPKQEKSEIQLIDDARTADRLLNWINKRIGRQVVLHHFFKKCFHESGISIAFTLFSFV